MWINISIDYIYSIYNYVDSILVASTLEYTFEQFNMRFHFSDDFFKFIIGHDVWFVRLAGKNVLMILITITVSLLVCVYYF